MATTIAAEDLWPLILKLSDDERVRLAKLALHAAGGRVKSDALAYEMAPPRAEEFACDDDPLSWDAEGWGEFDAPG